MQTLTTINVRPLSFLYDPPNFLLFPTSMDDREDEVLGELGKQYTKSILEVLLRASTYGGAKKVRKK